MFGIKSEKCTLHSLQGTLIPEDRIFLALARKGISEFLKLRRLMKAMATLPTVIPTLNRRRAHHLLRRKTHVIR